MMLAIFFLSLLFIVSVHEFGHYILARCFNVGVETFSIGLGRPLFSIYSRKQGTHFQMGLLPIGGYVKFAEDASTDYVLYTSLNAWKKILILLAGPMFNVIMAFLMLLGLMQSPHYQLYPMLTIPDIGNVKITEVNHHVVGSWFEVKAILDQEQKIDSVAFKRLSDDAALEYPIRSGEVHGQLDAWLRLQGVDVYYPALPAVIGGFTANSSAKAAGMQLGDKILAINQTPIRDIQALASCLEQYADAIVDVLFLRQGKMLSLKVKLSSMYRDRKKMGVLGIKTQDVSRYPKWYHQVQYSWIQSFKRGFTGVAEIVGVQANGWKNIDKHYQSISGPIGIAHAAHQAWSMSLKSYCLFLIWLNLGIAFMNLLPLPILDGGQCVMVLIEKWFPRLLADNHKQLLTFLSIIVLFLLLALGLHNDWSFLQ